ncbi:MAG: 50S ribosomal protein L29 [Acidimicrobiia bacterium]|nr:50S ribosomal protein L29 [Acidimicrobiia bacterium]
MRAPKLRGLGEDALRADLADARAELFNLRFQLATNQLDNTARLGQVRADIARINTVLREIEREDTVTIEKGE